MRGDKVVYRLRTEHTRRDYFFYRSAFNEGYHAVNGYLGVTRNQLYIQQQLRSLRSEAAHPYLPYLAVAEVLHYVIADLHVDIGRVGDRDIR